MVTYKLTLSVLLAGCLCHLSTGFSVNIDRHQFRAGPFRGDVTERPDVSKTISQHPVVPQLHDLRQGPTTSLASLGQGLAALLVPFLGQALGGLLGPTFGSILGPVLAQLAAGITGTNRISLNGTDGINITTTPVSDNKLPDGTTKDILNGYLVNVPGFGDCVVLAIPGDDPESQDRMFLPLPDPFHNNRYPWNRYPGHHAPHTVNHLSVLPVPLAVGPLYHPYPHRKWRLPAMDADGEIELEASEDGETTDK